MILSIDPGPEKSGWAVVDEEKYVGPDADEFMPFEHVTAPKLLGWKHEPNQDLLDRIIGEKKFKNIKYLVIEECVSYGTTMGRTVLDTIFASGRIWQAWMEHQEDAYAVKITRPTVRNHMCGAATGVSAAVMRQRVYDIYAGNKGRRGAVGIKKDRGPLYGIKGDHIIDCLALAITFWAKESNREFEDIDEWGEADG